MLSLLSGLNAVGAAGQRRLSEAIDYHSNCTLHLKSNSAPLPSSQPIIASESDTRECRLSCQDKRDEHSTAEIEHSGNNGNDHDTDHDADDKRHSQELMRKTSSSDNAVDQLRKSSRTSQELHGLKSSLISRTGVDGAKSSRVKKSDGQIVSTPDKMAK